MERRFNSLRSLREYKHLSMEALARKLGVSGPTIWKWEQEEQKVGPGWLKTKQRIALKAAFTDEELAEAFDPDWTPSESDPVKEHEDRTTITICQPSDEMTPADIISELMVIMSKMNLNEMKAVLSSAKAVLATKQLTSIQTETSTKMGR